MHVAQDVTTHIGRICSGCLLSWLGKAERVALGLALLTPDSSFHCSCACRCAGKGRLMLVPWTPSFNVHCHPSFSLPIMLTLSLLVAFCPVQLYFAPSSSSLCACLPSLSPCLYSIYLHPALFCIHPFILVTSCHMPASCCLLRGSVLLFPCACLPCDACFTLFLPLHSSCAFQPPLPLRSSFRYASLPPSSLPSGCLPARCLAVEGASS